MRRRLPSLVTFALVAMAAVALAQVGSAPRARAAAVAATGSFEISNSHDGRPIFAAAGIAPGESTTGTVSIEDIGSVPVALTLRRGALLDTPGLGGGLLSGRLALRISDVTEPGTPVAVYAGPLDSMPEVSAGELEPGKARTFEFIATLPEGGSAGFQNAVQGAVTTVGYSWVASEASSGGEGGDGEAPGGGGSGAIGGGSGSPTEGNPDGAGSARAELSLRVTRIKRNLRHGRLVAWVNCDRTCRLSVRGRLRARAAGRRRGARIHLQPMRVLPAGPRRLWIRIPRGLRRLLRGAPAPRRLRAKLRFVAVGSEGERAAVRRTLRLRVGGR